MHEQQDPTSANVHRWLTPREFGERFGASHQAVRAVSRWLRAAGCQVRRYHGGQLVGCLSGTIPEVPSALRRHVAGTVTERDALELVPRLGPIRFRPMSVIQGAFYFSPTEFARVYGLETLQGQGLDGAGQKIGILSLSGVDPDDVGAFRDYFGLPTATITQVGLPPVGGAREIEGILDVTWSGALAPAAEIIVAAGDERTLFGAIGYFSGWVGQGLNRAPGAGLWLDRIAGGVFITLGLKLIVWS